MSLFPAISPTARTYSPGDVPSAVQRSLNGSVTGFRRGNRRMDQTLELTFSHLVESDMDLIKDHFFDRKGTFDTFFLPSEVWGDYQSSPPVGLIDNVAWRYESAPEITDVSFDRFTVEVSLRTIALDLSDLVFDGGAASATPARAYILDAGAAAATPARDYVLSPTGAA